MWKASDRWMFDWIADYQYTHQNGFSYGQLVSKEEIASASLTSPLYAMKAGTQMPNQNRQSYYRRNILNTGMGIKYAGNGFDVNSMTSWQFLHDKISSILPSVSMVIPLPRNCQWRVIETANGNGHSVPLALINGWRQWRPSTSIRIWMQPCQRR